MNHPELIGFSGDFTREEITSITEAVEAAEPNFRQEPSNDIMPPWFVVKDDIPGQSRVFIAHRFGESNAIVAHSLDELMRSLRTMPSD